MNGKVFGEIEELFHDQISTYMYINFSIFYIYSYFYSLYIHYIYIFFRNLNVQIFLQLI